MKKSRRSFSTCQSWLWRRQAGGGRGGAGLAEGERGGGGGGEGTSHKLVFNEAMVVGGVGGGIRFSQPCKNVAVITRVTCLPAVFNKS